MDQVLTGFQVASCGRDHGLKGFACKAFGSFEGFKGTAKLASARFGAGVLPRFGGIAHASESGAADLVLGQAIDAFDDLAGFAGLEVGPNFWGEQVGHPESGRGECVGGGAVAFREVKVGDRAGDVIGLGPTGGPCDQVKREPGAELDGLSVIRDVRSSRQGKGFFQPAGPCRLFGLLQDDPPLSEHG
jgi:hypothetical protein